jgi:hypothetical protein
MITCGSHFEIDQQEGPASPLISSPRHHCTSKAFHHPFSARTHSVRNSSHGLSGLQPRLAQLTSSSPRSMPNMYEYNTVASIPFRGVTPGLTSLDSIRTNCWTPTAPGGYAVLRVFIFHWIRMQDAVCVSLFRASFTLVVFILQDAVRAARHGPEVEAIIADTGPSTNCRGLVKDEWGPRVQLVLTCPMPGR